MKPRILLLTVLFLSSLSLAWAVDQVFSLKDGSQLRGELVGVVNGVYTIKTTAMGKITVPASNVVNISNGSMPVAPSQVSQNSNLNKADINAKFQQTQTQLMTNPAAMADIQAMANDPEILEILSDPAFVQSVTNRDINSVSNNPKTQKLLNNPKMKALIEKIQASE